MTFGRKMLSTTTQNYDTNFIRINKASLDRPRHGLGTIGVQYGEKYFSTKHSSFSRDFFSPFQIFAPLVLDIFSISRCICYVVSNVFCVIFAGKIIITKINLPPSRNRQIRIKMSRLGLNMFKCKLSCLRIRITLEVFAGDNLALRITLHNPFNIYIYIYIYIKNCGDG